jgi:polyhydroxyalkanoate synthesis regulator phasin
MSLFRKKMVELMQDPRASELMRDPRVQDLAVRAFRLRGRVEGAVDRQLQKAAGHLKLATQKDLRGLHRRIRHLERELREAEERLSEREDDPEAPAHS